MYADSLNLVQTELRLRTVSGRIMQLDEILTMSARMAAATGDLVWEQRYRSFEPLLDAAIEEASVIAPEVYIGSATAATYAANQALVSQEHDAFELVRAGRPKQASALLFSREYAAQKAIYAQGMETVSLAVERRARALLAAQRRKLEVTAAIALAFLAVLILIWGHIIRLIRSSLGSLAGARRELLEINQDLEQRVEQRTADILAAHRSLELEVHRRMTVEIELRQSQKLESVGRLASGVAHEINTPVQFVNDSIHFLRDAMEDLMGLLQAHRATHRGLLDGRSVSAAAAEIAIAEDAADLPYLVENVPRAFDRAVDGLGRVTVIVRAMKSFAHPEQKEMEAADLNEAILSTLTIASHEYRYVAELETDLGDLPPVICRVGDVNQAVLNIVVNGAHAVADVVERTGSKGVIRVRTRREGDSVLVTISDSGGGIPLEVRDRIFDPFFTTKAVGKGSGQGLAIAHSIVNDQHGGQLTFETELGKGTTFYLRLSVAGKAMMPDAVAA